MLRTLFLFSFFLSIYIQSFSQAQKLEELSDAFFKEYVVEGKVNYKELWK